MSQNAFTRNLVTLVSGAALAQAIPILASPVLARLYDPSAFGVLGVFVACISVIANIVNGRYELAIGLQVERSDAMDVSRLATAVALAAAALVLIGSVVAFLVMETVRPEFQSEWLLLLPAMAVLLGFHNVLTYNVLRTAQFSLIAKTNVIRSAAAVAVQVAAAYAGLLAMGLVLGSVIGLISCVYALGSSASIRLSELLSRPTPEMKTLARKYSGYPLHSMPAALANGLSQHSIAFLVPYFFGLHVLGLFVLMQRIVDVPLALIGNSSRQVFYQRAADEFQSTGSCVGSFRLAFIRLFVIAVPIFSFAYAVSPWAFEVAFGADWSKAGEYARIVIPLAAIRFVVAPLTVANQVIQSTRTPLFFHLVLLLSTVMIFYIFGQAMEFADILSLIVQLHCLVYVIFFLVTLTNVLRRVS